MKKLNIIAVLLFYPLILFGQKTKVEYYTFTKNTLDTTGIRTYLLYDNEKSLFVWKSITQETKKTKEFKADSDNDINIKKVYRDTIGRRVFNKYFKDKLILREPLFENNFTVIDRKFNFNWKLTNDYKIIAGKKCQKAKANFRGRNYIAWFTEEIPVPTGPWKLHGLPGLILEAYDEKKEVNFIFKKLYRCKNSCEEIITNKNSKTISIEDFVNEKDNMYNKIMNKALSKLPRGTKIVTSSYKKRNGIEIKFEWEEEIKED